MTDVATILENLKSNPLVKNIDKVAKGHHRIWTGFHYPDGSAVDVFVPVINELSLKPPVLTDFGNTIAWLNNLSIRPYKSPRRGTLEHIMALHNCRYEDGMIEYQIEGWDQNSFSQGIINLGQACARLSDLVFGARNRAVDDFDLDVADKLATREYEFIENFEIPRKSNNVPIKLKFLVKGLRNDTGIMTLSSANKQQAHKVANEIYVRWDDIDLDSDWRGNKVTIYNNDYVYDDLILEHLERKCTLIASNDNEALFELLNVA